jgi:hypothetical protein
MESEHSVPPPLAFGRESQTRDCVQALNAGETSAR